MTYRANCDESGSENARNPQDPVEDSRLIGNLSPATLYSCAVYGIGDGDVYAPRPGPSATIQVATLPLVTPTPTPQPEIDVAAPTGLSVVMTGSSTSNQSCSAKFTWDIPTGAVAYQYEAVLVGNEGRNPQQPPHGPVNEHVFYGLWCSTEYQFRVKARGNGSLIWQGVQQDVIYTIEFSEFATLRATTGPYTPRPNVKPTFNVAYKEYFFHVRKAYTIDLPVATGGNGELTYSFAPALGNGLMFDEVNHHIMVPGVGPVAADQVTYTLTVEDSDGVTDTTEIIVSVFDVTFPAEILEYRRPMLLEELQSSIFDRIDVGLADALLTRSRSYEARVGLPATAGYEVNTNTCTWSASGTLWSNWLTLNGATNIRMTRCGRGAEEAVPIQVELRYIEGGATKTIELVTLPLTIVQARHHRDNVASYRLEDPWLPTMPSAYSSYPAVSQSTLQSLVESGKSGWSTGGFSFTEAASSPDFIIKGYFTNDSKCIQTAIACFTQGAPGGHFTDTGTLWIEFPPTGNGSDPREWTTDPNEIGRGQMDYYYLPYAVHHEMGHAAGLGHTPPSEASIMREIYQEEVVTIQSHDTTAISNLYSGHTPH